MLRYAASALLLVSLASNIECNDAAGNIGCLFSETLCNQEKEWCFNDVAFGKCLPLYGNIRDEDLQRFNFGANELHVLEREMQRLFLLGYRWSHTYTQCVLQSILISIKNKSENDFSNCNAELDQDLEGALKAIEGEEREHVDPRNLAIVRFSPSVADPHSDYADEFYYPPVEEMLPPYRGQSSDKEEEGKAAIGGEKGQTTLQEQDDGSKKEEAVEEVKSDKDRHPNTINLPPAPMSLSSPDHVIQENPEEEEEAEEEPPTPMEAYAPPPLDTYDPPPPLDPYDDPSPPMDSYQDDMASDYNYNFYPYSPPHYDYDFKIPRRYLEEDEDDADEVLLPQDILEERLSLNPQTMPSMYQEGDDPESMPYEISEKDYNYDLLFHSPYASPPKMSQFYKKKRASGMKRNGDQNGRDENPFRPPLHFKSRNLRELAQMLKSIRPNPNRQPLGSKPLMDFPTGRSQFVPPPKEDTDRTFNGRRYTVGDIGYFQNSPLASSYERPRPEEQIAFSPYENPYPPRPFSPPFQSQIPELEPPPTEDQNYSPETLHPPYIKSDYDKPKDPPEPKKPFGNSVSRFDTNSNPIYETPDRSPTEDRTQYQWMMADGAQGGNSYPLFKDSQQEYRSQYGDQHHPMALPPRQPSDAYYDRPAYPAYSLNSYYYNDYPMYSDFGDYMDAGAGPPHLGRDQRLDVKKPGPLFKSANNFAFDDYMAWDNDYMTQGQNLDDKTLLLTKLRQNQGLNEDGTKVRSKLQQDQVPDLLLTEEGYVEAAGDESRRRGFGQTPKAAQMIGAKNLLGTGEHPQASQEKEPDSYVYITISERFASTKEAEQMIYLILNISGLDMKHVQNLSVNGDQVMFQLLKNPKRISAARLAEITEEHRDTIKAKTDMKIIQAGVGTKTAMSAVVYSSGERQMLAAAAIVCGVCAALLVAATALFFLRRHSRFKAKLQDITAHDSEASKDYQELCRARMAGKGDGKDPLAGGPGHAHPVGSTTSGHAPGQRISSLSKESDNGNNSPSSRSSTSSWSEEPVISNMDISTGHMVLSYMEDHLRNKDRLEQEWVALCAYEAEPCACNIALKPENARKNRYHDILPYDHNRVILNEHTNVSGSSYINASSITDHDPRNPAYIATQGPLTATAADFWQLVWEQGSVVIVMLTRLTENGQALSHRYWPEEGSELYHIYEVHLVSEHVWCDDYLVRSFYLKNVRTGETRTVTQFHFLSWPESGIPASTKALLEFRRKVNKSYRGRSCPIIVHCSDGIGRTGTYCLIDMVLNRMSKGAKEIDIAATLEHIRDQRPNMVKTKVQFEFVLMSVAEEVHAILKALPQ